MKRLLSTLLMLCFFAQPCLAASQAKREVKEGNLLYNKGEFEQALKSYGEALLDSPDSDIVNFNLGAAFYKTKNYPEAIEHFERSLVSNDPSLEQKAGYNIGNAKYKYGIGMEDSNLSSAVQLLQESLRHYERALGLDVEDEDAKYNYEFVKRELKRLQEKLKQRQKSSSQEEKKEGGGEGGKGQEPLNEEQAQPKQQPEQPDEDKDEEQLNDGARPEEGGAEEEAQELEQTKGASQPTAEISEKQALMLLDSYSQEEEPRGLYKEKIPQQGLPQVLRDW